MTRVAFIGLSTALAFWWAGLVAPVSVQAIEATQTVNLSEGTVESLADALALRLDRVQAVEGTVTLSGPVEASIGETLSVSADLGALERDTGLILGASVLSAFGLWTLLGYRLSRGV